MEKQTKDKSYYRYIYEKLSISKDYANRACNTSKIVSKTHSDCSEKIPKDRAAGFFVGMSLYPGELCGSRLHLHGRCPVYVT